MVKTPRTRHSKTEKEPVTIDLAPGDVARVSTEPDQPGDAVAADAPDDTVAADANSEPAPRGADGEKADAAAGDQDQDQDRAATGAGDTAGASADTVRPRDDRKPDAASPGAGFGRKEAAASPPPPPPPAPRRGGALAGGVAGGVIALLVAGGLQYSGFLPGLGRTVQTDTAAVSALEVQVAQLKERLDALGQAGGDPALDGRVAQAEERVSALASELDQLRAQVSSLGSGEPGEMPAVDLGPLEARISAVEANLAALGSEAGDAPSEDALAAVEGQFSALREAIAALRTATDQSAGDIAAIREDVTAARDAQSAAISRIDALERTLGELGSKVDEQAAMPGTATIIAASALKAAIDRGLPFVTELETYASLAPDAPEIEELRGYASTGVPTRSQIAAESDAAANAMIAVSRPVDPQAGFVDKLWGSAMGLVQVRPIGMVEGEEVPQIAARLDAAVQAGDYERAIAEFASLPDAAKAAGEGFMAKVQARHAADRLVDQALAAALKA